MAQTKLPCNRAHLKVVNVDSRVKFDAAVARFLGLGFLVSTRGVDRARLEKRRTPLNPKYVLVGRLVPVLAGYFSFSIGYSMRGRQNCAWLTCVFAIPGPVVCAGWAGVSRICLTESTIAVAFG